MTVRNCPVQAAVCRDDECRDACELLPTVDSVPPNPDTDGLAGRLREMTVNRFHPTDVYLILREAADAIAATPAPVTPPTEDGFTPGGSPPGTYTADAILRPTPPTVTDTDTAAVPRADAVPEGVVPTVDGRHFFDCSTYGMPDGWTSVQRVHVPRWIEIAPAAGVSGE